MEEAGELEAVHRDMRDRGVAVVGVSAWGESDEEVVAFKKKKGLSYTLVLGTSKMVLDYKVSALPTLYIIGKDGKIAASHSGFWSRNDIAEAVSKVLGDSR